MAQDLVDADPVPIQRKWSIVLAKTVRELQGTSCIDLEDLVPDKQQIACARSFGRPVTELADLLEAITEFTARAAEKLRRQDSQAGQILVFMRTSPFRRDDPQYSGSRTVALPAPTADTTALTEMACAIVRHVYRPGYRYAKAGVMLLDLRPAAQQQLALGLGDEPIPERARLMEALDRVNGRWGRGTLQIAGAGTGGGHRKWEMKQERKTPSYTTDWRGLVVAR